MKSALGRDVFGSILFKMSLAFLTLGAATAAAIVVGILVFNSLSTSMRTMSGVVLPEIADKLRVIEQTGLVREQLAEISLADNAAVLAEATTAFEAGDAQLQEAILDLSEADAAGFLTLLGDLRAATADLTAAQLSRYTAETNMGARIRAFRDLAEKAKGRLVELTDEAVFDLTMGGEATVLRVNETLSNLTDDEFQRFQRALDLNAETNLSIGLLMALVQSTDEGYSAIVSDIAAGSLGKIRTHLDEFAAEDAALPWLDTMQQAAAFMESVRERPGAARASTLDRLVSLQREVDISLSEMTDELSFGLMLIAAETASSNEEAISSLLEGEVSKMRLAAEVEGAVNDLFVAALLGAAADDVVKLDGAQAALNEAANRLKRLREAGRAPEVIVGLLDQITALADPGTGLLHTRRVFLQEYGAARDRARDASAKLAAISAAARDQGNRALGTTIATGEAIVAQADAARSQMNMIAAASAGLFVICLAALRLTVMRPLGRLTEVTQRLSAGDLAPVVGFERTGGELGRMASALSVFRDGMIQRQDLEAQEKLRVQEEFEAERRAEAERHEAAERAAQEKAEREAAERARDAEADEARRSVERQAQAEREARAAEQTRIVGILGEALGQLASGKLTTRIDEEFPGTYEALRRDFNAASGKLAEAIALVIDSAHSIRNEANEIASATGDLNQRTEKQAATLEQTAAALDELTASVQAAASVADSARRMVEGMQDRAERSGGIVRNTVAAMQEIADSSAKISKITNVIDEIAFQTNLLALNAGVEAARAGEAGRGFAVVASEVRALAQRSSDAAREIADLIDLSSSQVRRGVTLVDEAGEAITQIEASVTGVKEQIVGIATSASEQATGIREINVAVNQLDQVTQQNAALSEQTNAATQSMLSMSTALIDSTAKFDVADAARATPARAPAAADRAAPAGEALVFESRRSARLGTAVAAGGGAAVRVADTWEEF